jgi:hypothetical protein
MFLTCEEKTIELTEEQVKQYIPTPFWNTPLFIITRTPELERVFNEFVSTSNI